MRAVRVLISEAKTSVGGPVAGEHLRGRAKAKLDALTERLKAERSTYMEVARASASTDRERYEHMDPRVAALVQARIS